MKMNWPVLGKHKDENHEGEILHHVNGFDVIACQKCGFKHIVPIPSQEELEHIYKHEYYSTDKPLYLKRHEEDLEWWNIDYENRLKAFDKLKPNTLPKKILDVGSGPGYFLLKAKELGWTVTGIEPSKQAANHSRKLGLSILEGFLNKNLFSKLGQFSAVHLSEVLEHISDPGGFLKIIFKLLKPEGVIGISVPNDYSPIHYALTQVDGYKPWWVVPPHHINYFDFDSLVSLLEKVGFKVVHRDATFPIDMFLLMGENYIGDDMKGREIHNMRKRFELTLENAGLSATREGILTSFANLGLGRTIIVYAIK